MMHLVLSVALAIEVTVLLVCAVVLIFHSAWLVYYRRWSQPVLEQAVLSSGEDVAHLSRRDIWRLKHLPFQAEIKLFSALDRTVSSTERKRVTDLLHEAGLVGRAERRCRDRVWWKRLHAVRLLTLIGGGESVVPALLGDPSPVVRAQASDWAADHPTPGRVQALLGLLDDPSGLCRFKAANALVQIGALSAEPLAAYITAAQRSERSLLAGLGVAEGIADPRFLTPATALSTHTLETVRVGSARVLGNLGGAEGTDALQRMLVDQAPTVRAAAARALGVIGHWPAAPAMANLLRDRAWVVRHSAGLALRALGSPGRLFLQEMTTDEDRFAADMARQALDLPETGRVNVP